VDRTNPAYKTYWPSPIVFHDKFLGQEAPKLSPDPESVYMVQTEGMRVFNNDLYREQYRCCVVDNILWLNSICNIIGITLFLCAGLTLAE